MRFAEQAALLFLLTYQKTYAGFNLQTHIIVSTTKIVN